MIAGRYTLEREIGRGGMGAVWLGRDEVLGRPVAVKIIGMAPDGVTPDLERAEREARLAARLNHPHVVAVFDLVRDADHQWLVMEYVEGTTLTELVRQQGPLPADDAAALLAQAADALAAAHEAGIVHRDVKPSNILVTPEGQAKLADFGIARADADPTLTRTGLVTGSPAYLAPEVAVGGTATAASDVWSLGATLYHALSGGPPYEVGDNLLGTLYRIVHEDPPRLAHPGWLGPLLEATMAREPAERWSMADVRDVLRAGPGARPPAGPPRQPLVAAAAATATAPQRRGPGLLPVLLGVAAVVLLTTAGFVVGYDGDPGPGGSTSRSSRTPQPDPTPRSTSPSSTPVERPTAEGMTRFVTDYLTTAAADPEAGFAMLTPRFQEASGGLAGYTGFWGRVTGVSGIEVLSTDVAARTVSYRYTYLPADGRPVTDSTTLRLSFDDGRYRIHDELPG